MRTPDELVENCINLLVHGEIILYWLLFLSCLLIKEVDFRWDPAVPYLLGQLPINEIDGTINNCYKLGWEGLLYYCVVQATYI